MTKKRASSSVSRSKAQLDGLWGMVLPPVEQVVRDAPSTVPVIVPTVALPTDVVMRLLNVLEELVPNHGRLP
ncbi:hypothetical protein HAX54_028660, partial [Datura stramonium]|nr:hypothetical protein [Datura stramonium]